MKLVSPVLMALLIFLVLIIISACEKNPYKMALNATDSNEGISAVAKITDQALLGSIALDADEWKVSYSAIKKLTDPDILVKVAIEARQSSSPEFDTMYFPTIEKLTDPVRLAKVAVEANGYIFRKKAVEKLIDPTMLAVIVNEKEDRRVQFIYKLIKEFDSVPQNYRVRFITEIASAFDVLTLPEVIDEIGEIISTSVNWTPIEEYYQGDFSGHMEGEHFECNIEFKKLSRPFFYSWSTDFPKQTSSFRFMPAEVDATDILYPVFDQLSQILLAKIALGYFDYQISKSAIEKLTDQSLIAIIAIKANPMCLEAVEKLTDQNLLAKLALEADYNDVRSASIKKLVDQPLLSKIALKGNQSWIRKAAVKNLTDKVLLTKIALEDTSYYVRKAAIQNITDQALLTKIIKDVNDKDLQRLARERLDSIQNGY